MELMQVCVLGEWGGVGVAERAIDEKWLNLDC